MSRLYVFNEKKVLLVCAETFTWPMHYIAEAIRPYCKNLSAIFIQPAESYFAAPDLAMFKSLNKDIETLEMKSVVENYLNLFKAAEKNVDWDYIKYIEREYTAFSSLNEQFLTEMTFLPYYHDRKYYEDIDYNKILLFVQLYYKYVENIFATQKPDIILDTDVDFFGRSVLLEVSNKYSIPYISIDHARLDGFVIPTATLVKKQDQYIKSLFNKYAQNDKILTDDAVEEIYNHAKEIVGEIPSVFREMHSKREFSIKKMFRQLVIMTIVSLRYVSFKKIKINVFQGASSPICSNVFKSWMAMYMYFIRRLYLNYSNTFDRVDLKKINYLYVPLHVIPESSTTILSPYYINETFIIESLSKSVRPDQYIVVKEHWSMIGYRPVSYYKKIKRLPNVILIDPASPLQPRDYIINSDLVVTISGSAAFEASMLGINSLVFSDVIYGMLSSCRKVCVDGNLRKVVAEHIRYKMPERELYAYIKILLDFGKKVRLKKLLLPPTRTDKTEISQDIENLLEVFLTGIAVYNENQNWDTKNEI